MDVSISVSEARAAFAELLERVADGDEVTLTRHGEPVAVLIRPDSLRSRRLDDLASRAEAVRDVMERGRSKRLGPPPITAERASELVAEVDASRSAR